jgi:hypothetical protein
MVVFIINVLKGIVISQMEIAMRGMKLPAAPRGGISALLRQAAGYSGEGE